MLFAAYRVLLRLTEPRHPPSALLLSLFLHLRLSSKEIRLLDLLSLVQYVKDRMESCIPTVENKGLEPLTPCVQGRCSKPTELIPQDTGTYKVNTVVPGRVDACDTLACAYL